MSVDQNVCRPVIAEPRTMVAQNSIDNRMRNLRHLRKSSVDEVIAQKPKRQTRRDYVKLSRFMRFWYPVRLLFIALCYW